MKKLIIICALFFFFPFSTILPQIFITGTPYTQDFNTLANTGTSDVMPVGWHFFESGSGADGLYTANHGSSTSGDTYSYGSEGDNDRALGVRRTGTLVSTIGANFINNTGAEITQLYITYTGEQWRVGANRPDPDILSFQFSTDATSLSDGNWTPVTQLDFSSPLVNTNTGAVDGNAPENRTTVAFTITGLSIANGSGFWIRWLDFDVSGTDDGLAVDDFTIDLNPPPVVFSMNPSSLNFGSVIIGDSATLNVIVENIGASVNLDITNAVSSNPLYTFEPNSFPISIAPGNSQEFTVKFKPDTTGLKTGTIDFTHNAPGSPSSLSLSGIGQSPSSGGVLKFITDVRNLLDGTQDNKDTIVLSGHTSSPVKALQFKVLIGKTNGGLILRSVSRGSAVPVSDFNFSYEISSGNILPDGSSIDTVKVVILGNDSNEISPDPGDQEIAILSYDVVSITGVSSQTFLGIQDVTGATSPPVVNAEITAGHDEIINIFNGTLEGLLGDVNLDNYVNILDLLLMIDYILGKTEFDADQFFNGDLSPWTPGDPLPTRDGVIDVLDLALLQDIILTGLYPNGSSVHKSLSGYLSGNSNKLSPGMDVKLSLFITENGLTASLESIKKVKGLQLELNELNSIIPQQAELTSVFDQAFYYQNNSFVRILTYDSQSNPVMPGEFIVADIPFTITNPEGIVVQNVIVADENNKAIEKIEVEINYYNPDIPMDYILHQNYPNPFNPTTSIRFEVPDDGFVTIKIYDMLGQEVAEIFSGEAKAGKYLLNWDGKDNNGNQVSSGSYIYQMTAGDFISSKKMLLIK